MHAGQIAGDREVLVAIDEHVMHHVLVADENAERRTQHAAVVLADRSPDRGSGEIGGIVRVFEHGLPGVERGLGAMRPNVQRGAVRHIRPFLEIPKRRLIATCSQNDWHYAKDPSNEDKRFTRTRIRALLPILAGEGLTAERLGTLAARARRTEDALDHVAKRTVENSVIRRAADGGAIRLKAEPFYTEPFDLALRMLKRSMLAIGAEGHSEGQISLAKLERLLKHLRMAIRDQRPFRQTLAWSVIAHGGGFIEVRTAPPRRSAQEKSRAGNAR